MTPLKKFIVSLSGYYLSVSNRALSIVNTIGARHRQNHIDNRNFHSKSTSPNEKRKEKLKERRRRREKKYEARIKIVSRPQEWMRSGNDKNVKLMGKTKREADASRLSGSVVQASERASDVCRLDQPENEQMQFNCLSPACLHAPEVDNSPIIIIIISGKERALAPHHATYFATITNPYIYHT